LHEIDIALLLVSVPVSMSRRQRQADEDGEKDVYRCTDAEHRKSENEASKRLREQERETNCD